MCLAGCGAGHASDEAESLGSRGSALAGCEPQDAVCQIDPGSAADHADPLDEGSIAWHFENSERSLFHLKTGTFNITRTIQVPSGVTLQGDSATATIRPLPDFDNGTAMIRLSSSSALRGVAADGDSRPGFIVDARNTDSATIADCVLRETSLVRSAHVVLADESANLRIENSQIGLAGIPSSKVATGTCDASFKGFQAAGVHCTHCFDLVVTGSGISYTRTAGIHMTGTLRASITDNEIFMTSMNTRISSQYCRAGDGITAYHNNSNPFPADYTILNNTIWRFHNHGIHVSGSNVRIERNTVDGHADQPSSENYGHSAIYYVDGGDLFPGSECGKNVLIANNELYRGKSPLHAIATKEIVRVNYDASTFQISSNTGGVDPNSPGIEIRSEHGTCSGNHAPVPRLSPKAYYEFRQGVGVDTVGAASATTHNGVKTVLDAQLGRALFLDGHDDYLRVDNHPLPATATKIMITALIKPAHLEGTMQIFSKDQCNLTDCSQRDWQFRLRSGGRLEFIVYNSSGLLQSSISPSNTVPAGEWSFVAGSYDGTTVKVYHTKLPANLALDVPDIKEFDPKPFNGALARSANAAFIGRSENNNAGYFMGFIDDVAIFDDVLTPSELKGNVINYGHMRTPDNELLHPPL
jgi:hypothetical protein